MQSTRRVKLDLPVARAVLEDVAAGRLRAGERVSEAAYSQRCKVSRTPVRQALQFLQKIRAVIIRSRFGARVRASAASARALLKSRSFLARKGASNETDPAFVDVAERIKMLLAAPDGFADEIVKDAVVARKLGVSRTTANRALAILARQHLLVALPRRGWKRVVVGPREIVDFYNFRLAIEPAALDAAWERLDLATMKDLLARTVAAINPKTKKPMSACIALDVELHHAILQACPNPLLRRSMEEQEALRVIAVTPSWRILGRMEGTFREHAAILKAIIKRDRRGAIAALRDHLMRARDATAKRLTMAD